MYAHSHARAHTHTHTRSLALSLSLSLMYTAHSDWSRQSLDEVSLPEKLRSDVGKFYPNARVSPLRSGGNFPYLSRSGEFNMYLIVRRMRA